MPRKRQYSDEELIQLACLYGKCDQDTITKCIKFARKEGV